MKGQNIRKYYQNKLNLRCKSDKKKKNYIISWPCNKMFQGSQENWTWKNDLIIDSGGENETKYNRISILVLYQLTFEKTIENKSGRHR